MMDQHTPELMFQFSDDFDNATQENETEAQHSHSSSTQRSSQVPERRRDPRPSHDTSSDDSDSFVLGGGRIGVGRFGGGGQLCERDHQSASERTASVTSRPPRGGGRLSPSAEEPVHGGDRHVSATAAALVAAAGPLRIDTAGSSCSRATFSSLRQCRTPQYLPHSHSRPPVSSSMSMSSSSMPRGCVGSMPSDYLPLGSPVGSHKVCYHVNF